MKEKTYEDPINGVVLTIPISDTVPGPGNIQFQVDSFEDWQEKYLIEDAVARDIDIGAGTAKDVPSS